METGARSPETNAFCKRFRRTVEEEFFTVAFRKTLSTSVDQLQADLDRYPEFYNGRGFTRTTAPKPDALTSVLGVNDMLQDRVAGAKFDPPEHPSCPRIFR